MKGGKLLPPFTLSDKIRLKTVIIRTRIVRHAF